MASDALANQSSEDKGSLTKRGQTLAFFLLRKKILSLKDAR